MQILSNKYVRNVFWLLSDKSLSIVMMLVVAPLIVRFLGSSSYGMMSAYTTIYMILQSFVSAGAQQVLVAKNVSVDHAGMEDVNSSAIMSLLIGGGGGYLIGIFYVFVRILMGAGSEEVLLGVFLFLGLFTQFGVIATAYFEANVESKYAVKHRMNNEVIQLISRSLLLLFRSQMIMFAVVTRVFIPFVRQFILIKIALKKGMPKPRISKMSLKKGLSFRLSMLGVSFASLVSIWNRTGSQVMLSWFGSYEDVAVFNIPMRLVEFLYFAPIAINATYFPRIIEAISEGQNSLENCLVRLMRIHLSISVAISVVVFIFGGDLIVFLYGDEFAQSGSVLLILVWSVFFVAHSNLKFQLMIAFKDMKNQLYTSMIMLVVMLLLNIYLINLLGLTGAAVTCLICSILNGVVTTVFFKKYRWLFKLQMQSFLPFTKF